MNELLFLGDFLYDYDTIQKDIFSLSDHIHKNNYAVILNLEGPLKGAQRSPKWSVMSHDKKSMKVLKKLNVLGVSLANNHVLDWGEKGFRELIYNLEKEHIPYFGAGLDIERAYTPQILEIEGLKVCLLGFCWDFYQGVTLDSKSGGVASLKENLVLEKIELMKEKVDRIILVLHWGYEYEKYPLPIHRDFAHRCIDKGADMIIGHHPHIIQVKEVYKNKPIYYSLGNFYFGSRRNEFVNFYLDKTNSSRYGLGVIWNPTSEEISEIFFDSKSHCTEITKTIKIDDISEIPLEDYNTFFKNNRTSNKAPSLYIDRPIQNKFKVFKRNIKSNLRKYFICILVEFGLFESFKKWMSEFML